MAVQSSYDFDGTPYPLAEQALDLDQEQLSQELQLGGDAAGGRLQWVTGLFYFREDAQDAQDIPSISRWSRPATDPSCACPADSRSPASSPRNAQLCGLRPGDIAFRRPWSSTVGLRYTDEEKTLDSYVTGAFVRPPGTVSDSWSDLSPRLGLEYRISDRAMTYVSASRGYRSGGFNGRNTTPNPPQSFEPETISAYEIGLKTESDDRRLRFNSAAFYYDYEDFQGLTLDSFSGITITVGNIAKVEMYGVEFDLAARPTEALQLSLAAGYTKHDIAEVAAGAQITIRPDTRLINAPEWTATAAVDYTLPMGKAGDLDLHVDYGWKSDVEFFLPNFPDEGQDAYGVLNAHVGFAPGGSNWRIEVFGDNLTSEEYRLFAENGTPLGVPATTAIYARPREWGARFKVEFD